MTRHIERTNQILNLGRPLFVKHEPFQSAGKFWKRGERYNWDFLSIPLEKVKWAFDNGFIHHNHELEEETAKKVVIGDGLEELSLDQLNVLVSNINAKVKEKTDSVADFMSKKCPTSKIKDKQIGLIRRWRMTYGHLE